MKKLIFGISFLLVALTCIFAISSNIDVNEKCENEISSVTTCAKNGGHVRNGQPGDGVVLT